MNDLFNEIVEGHEKDLPQIMKLVFDVPYNFLFINTDTQKLYKNWDEIKCSS